MRRYRFVDIPLERNKVREVEAAGVKLRGTLSQADFPNRLRIEVLEDPSRVHIELFYGMATDERRRDVEKDSGAKLVVGELTGRVFEIEVPLPEDFDTGRLSLEINAKESINQLEQEARNKVIASQPHRRIAHYQMISDLLPMMDEKIRELKTAQQT